MSSTNAPRTYQVAQRPLHVKGADPQPFVRFSDETDLLGSAGHTWARWQTEARTSGLGGEVGILIDGQYFAELSDAFRQVFRLGGECELRRYMDDLSKVARRNGVTPELAAVLTACGSPVWESLQTSTSVTAPTVEQIRSRIAALEGELAKISGEGLLIWDGRE